ncbi:tetratricopeptide repeat protein [Flavobacterium subsaxonicum]|uniref:Uncharacterized protein n=1 Tax=Flavobacterium subsaxonicum WB 4.1-42 = DSM 21790 TaxID=1121898 RepID=A0A0A2MNL7_9FLAO|nr:tetratricopeptide repeat protein [Flavobacterium subsaxonicum]KGO93058.1 hypothetical protein Q766_10615 [Flavobacterium subsaxonicum WB 4.1-42 = DSM 21790]
MDKIIFTFLFLYTTLLFSQSNYDAGIELLKTEQYIEAIKKFDLAEKDNNKNSAVYFNRAMCYTVLEKYPEALKDYDKTIKLDSKNYQALFFRGLVKKDLKDYKGAVKDLLEAYDSDATLTRALLKSGEIYLYNIEDYKKAIEVFDTYLSYDPDNALVLAYMGNAYGSIDNAKNKKTAIGYMDKAIAIKQESWYYLTRGRLYFDLFDFDHDTKNLTNAIDNFTVAIKLAPTESKLYFWRAEVYFQLKQKENACPDYIKAAELGYDVPKYKIDLCKSKGHLLIVD